MNKLLLEQAIIEYRIKHIINTPHLKAKYLAEYKRENGSNVLDEGLRDWLKGKFGSAKTAVKSAATKASNVVKGVVDMAFGFKGATILAGSETFDIEKRKNMIGAAETALKDELEQLKVIFTKYSKSKELNYGTKLSELNDHLISTGFPNSKSIKDAISSESFKKDVNLIKVMYFEIVENYKNKEMEKNLANLTIAVLRHLIIFYQDYKVHDPNLYLNEQQTRELQILLEAEKNMDLGDGTFLRHSIEGRKEGDVSASYEAAYSAKLPAALIIGGASLIALGIGADSDIFQNLLERFKDMGNATPDQISNTIGKVLVVKKGEGITQVMSRMSGIDLGPSAKLSALLNPKLKAIFPLIRMAVEIKNPGSGGKAFDQLIQLAGTNGNQTLGQSLQGDFSGTSKSIGDLLDVDQGGYTEAITKVVKGKAAEPLNTLKNKFLSSIGNLAGPILTGLGFAVAAGGGASAALRTKGKLSSRMATLKNLVDTFKDVGSRGKEGEEGGAGGAGEPPPEGPEGPEAPEGPEGIGKKGETVYVYKRGPGPPGSGKEDKNSLTRILMGLDLPNWAVKDLTDRVKKELEANNFVVKENLLNEERYDVQIDQGVAKHIKRKENPIDKLMSYKDIISNIESQLKKNKYNGTVRDFIEKVFSDKRIKDMFSLNEASNIKSQTQSLMNQIGKIIEEIGGFNSGVVKDLSSKLHNLFTTYKADLNSGKKEGQGGVAVDDPKTNEENPFTQPPVEPPKGPEGPETPTTTEPPVEPPQGPELPPAVISKGSNANNKLLNVIQEFASDTTIEGLYNKNGKKFRKQTEYTRKQILNNPQGFLDALSPEEKMLLLRLPDNPNAEPSKVDFFTMSTAERKEMYNKVKQGLIDFGSNEEVDTGRDKTKSIKGQKEKGQGREYKLPSSSPYSSPDQKAIEKKIQSLNSVIKNPKMSDEQKQKAKEQLPKLNRELEKAKKEIEATSNGVFNISDLRDILRTGHTRENENEKDLQGKKIIRRPIPDDKIRAAQKSISSYLSPYLKKAGVALRETQLNNVVLGFINEINKRFDNILFESRMSRWKVLANIK
jgi:hypothetical protein